MQLVPRESFINSDNLFLYNLLRYIQRIVKVGGCSVSIAWLNGRALVAVAQARCPELNSQQLPAFSLSSIFASQHLNSFLFSMRQARCSEQGVAPTSHLMPFDTLLHYS